MNRAVRGAFTLVELIVVIAIIAILFAIGVPVFQRSVAHSRAGACLSNLRQIGIALNLYLAEHEQVMPMLVAARKSSADLTPAIHTVLAPYVQEPRIFACPADDKNFAATTGTSYYWNSALNEQPVASLNFMSLATDLTHIPILSDKEGFHTYLQDKVNILYADGHATKDLKFFTGN